jgi:hypothetical protein
MRPLIDELVIVGSSSGPDELTDDLAGTRVVTPAGLVFRRTFLVLGNLLSFLYFILRF